MSRDLSVVMNKTSLTEAEYRHGWRQLGPIEVRMISRDGKCIHDVGDRFEFENPYKPPSTLCYALVHVLNLYAWRVALGFPSWEPDDRSVYRIHCPSKKGTVWEMRVVQG